MTASEFVAATILKATGKTSTATSGDTKWTKVLGIGNFYIDNWQDEPDVDWVSLYDPDYSFGSVTATDTFSFPAAVRKLSDIKDDFVRIHHTDGVGYTDYEIVPPTHLKHYYTGADKENPIGNFCAQVGSDLVFNRVFSAADLQFGGTIKVPVYTFATHLSTDDSTVPVDIPNWLVLMAAAEYVRNDITRQNQYPNLIAEANQVMQKMRDNNDAQVEQVIRPWSAAGQTWA